MKVALRLMVLALAMALFPGIAESQAADRRSRARLLESAGRVFSSSEDPEYVAYDQMLRVQVAERIKRRYGVKFDPKAFSGLALLEIEAILKCKKSGEDPEALLKGFKRLSR